MGNLTKDIEMRYSQGGLAIAKSAVASQVLGTYGKVTEEAQCGSTKLDIVLFFYASI